jgi:transcriptional regulator with XRE-family HTH domain
VYYTVVMSTWIQNKRKMYGLSQSEVAQSLGVSRPTYMKLEQGIAVPTPEQQAILAGLFGTSRETVAENNKDESSVPETVYPRSVPKENAQRFKEVLLYIVSKVGSRPNIGQTALYKLLYFIDFDYYEKHQKYLIGATYIKNTFGPSPVSFAKITRELEKAGKLVSVKSKYFGLDQQKYMVTSEPEVSSLSAQELKHIDDELERLATKSAKELSDLSHKDTPWRVAEDRQVLNYRHVFYRPDETSVSDE